MQKKTIAYYLNIEVLINSFSVKRKMKTEIFIKLNVFDKSVAEPHLSKCIIYFQNVIADYAGTSSKSNILASLNSELQSCLSNNNFIVG